MISNGNFHNINKRSKSLMVDCGPFIICHAIASAVQEIFVVFFFCHANLNNFVTPKMPQKSRKTLQ